MSSHDNPSGTAGPGTEANGRPDVSGTSVGELISEVTSHLSTLMRQELELATAPSRNVPGLRRPCSDFLQKTGRVTLFQPPGQIVHLVRRLVREIGHRAGLVMVGGHRTQLFAERTQTLRGLFLLGAGLFL